MADETEDVLTHRDTIRAISPPWLQRGIAEKILYSIAIHLDGLTDAVTAGVKLRFPNLYSNESLPLIGRERRISRGRIETDGVYASRLARWLDDHRRRGGPFAMLSQLHAHFAPANFPIELVYHSGRRFSMDTDGNVTMDDIVWAFDDESTKWARWWLFYAWPTPLETDGIWSDPGTWDDGGVWDSNLSPAEVRDIRLVPREWNAAHALGRIVLMSPTAELWDYPPGVWDEPGDVWDPGGVFLLISVQS
jgi:hypothetical protein